MTKFNKDISYNDLPLLPPKKNLETIEVLGLNPYGVCMVGGHEIYADNIV